MHSLECKDCTDFNFKVRLPLPQEIAGPMGSAVLEAHLELDGASEPCRSTALVARKFAPWTSQAPHAMHPSRARRATRHVRRLVVDCLATSVMEPKHPKYLKSKHSVCRRCHWLLHGSRVALSALTGCVSETPSSRTRDRGQNLGMFGPLCSCYLQVEVKNEQKECELKVPKLDATVAFQNPELSEDVSVEELACGMRTY